MAGYSGTPLVKKLGIKMGDRIFLENAPPGYLKLVAPLPQDVEVLTRLSANIDVAHIFSTSKSQLERALKRVLPNLQADGAIWVSWPKKSAKVPTEVGEDTIRETAFPLGLVDIKVCAVDDTWSALKLVIRKKLRNNR